MRYLKNIATKISICVMLLTCGTTAGLLYDCIFVSNYDDFFGKKNINDRVKKSD